MHRRDRVTRDLAEARSVFPQATISFVGYGGSDPALETAVYIVNSEEVRVPFVPSRFKPDAVALSYLCIAAPTLLEAVRYLTKGHS